MIPHKEELKFFEDLYATQTQIWPGSADMGHPVSADLLAQIRDNLKPLKQFYGGRNWAIPGQSGVKYIRIPFEVTGDTVRGVELSVSVYSKPGKRAYMLIRLNEFTNRKKDVPVLQKEVA